MPSGKGTKRSKKKSLKLFGHKVTVEDDATLLDRDRWGEYDAIEMSIRLYHKMPQSKRREVLIHECLHAVCDAIGEDIEHKTIRSVAHGLAQMLDGYLKKV